MPAPTPTTKRRAAAAALIATAAVSHAAHAKSSFPITHPESTAPAQQQSLYSNPATLVMGGFDLAQFYYGLQFYGSFKNRIVWYAYTPDIGFEYWLSDGTTEGTYGLDLIPGVNSTRDYPNSGIGQLGNRMAIPVNDYLWSSDGTAGGSFQLSNVTPQYHRIRYHEFSDSYANLNGILYFKGRVGEEDELWRTDLTPEGTYQVINLDGASNSSPHFLASHNSQLFFTAMHEGARGLWRSDGTIEGTHEVWNTGTSTDFYPYVNDIFSLDNRVVFLAKAAKPEVPSNMLGKELLWSWDDVQEEAELLIDSISGTPFEPATLYQAGGRLAFTIRNRISNNTYRYALWLTDGNSENTAAILDPENTDDIYLPSRYDPIKGWGDLVFFTAAENQDKGLWVSDGTQSGTLELINYAFDTAVTRSILFSHDSGMFALLQGESDTLWHTDGTVEGTFQIADLGLTDEVRVLNDKIFFSTKNSLDDSIGEIWTIDLNTETFAQIRLEMILANFGAAAFGDEIIPGDVTGDGRTDIHDLNWVLRNWPGGEAPDINVPEPGTLAVLALGGLLLGRRRRG